MNKTLPAIILVVSLFALLGTTQASAAYSSASKCVAERQQVKKLLFQTLAIEKRLATQRLTPAAKTYLQKKGKANLAAIKRIALNPPCPDTLSYFKALQRKYT